MSNLSKALSKFFPQSLERQLRDFRDEYLRSYNIEKLPSEIYSESLKKYKVSFCSTCMNRLFHLRKTVIKNIENNENYPNVEFVLINYNSQDGLHEWAQKKLTPYIEKGVLNYYYTTEPKIFHSSISKNLAHKAAQGDIVCNLDGDNFTGKDYAYYINYLFNTHDENALFHFRKKPYWGTEGRIVLMKKKFEELGGYDESLLPTGHEDHDLLNRAKAKGMKYYNIEIENFLRYLSNTTKEKSVNFGDNAYYYDLESRNREKSNQNILDNNLVANPDGWAKIPLYKNFSNQLTYL